MFIRPWSKESERILHDLSKDKISITKNNGLAREFGHKCPELFNKGLLDVATTRYSKREDKTFFVTRSDIVKKGNNYHFVNKKIL